MLVLSLAANATAPNATLLPAPDAAGGLPGPAEWARSHGPGVGWAVAGGGAWAWAVGGVRASPGLLVMADAAAAAGLGPLRVFLALSLLRAAAAAAAAACVCLASCALGRRLHPRLLARVAFAAVDVPRSR